MGGSDDALRIVVVIVGEVVLSDPSVAAPVVVVVVWAAREAVTVDVLAAMVAVMTVLGPAVVVPVMVLAGVGGWASAATHCTCHRNRPSPMPTTWILQALGSLQSSSSHKWAHCYHGQSTHPC